MSAASRAAVSVDELQRAWRAVQAGQFQAGAAGRAGARWPARAGVFGVVTLPGWAPAERVLPVVGCAGSVGASTTALALAAAAQESARVIECCSRTASGLAAAATTELGCLETGWSRGRRGDVLLERVRGVLVTVAQVPLPAPPLGRPGLTVLDVGWDLGQVRATSCWLGQQVHAAPVVVAVSIATVPGLRRLESALSLLAGTRVVAAVVGPPRRRWPRGLARGMGPLSCALDRRAYLIAVPRDRALAVRGVDSTPLPAALLEAASQILRLARAGATRKGATS